MNFRQIPRIALCALLAAGTTLLGIPTAHAARVGVLSNASSAQVAADFNARVAGHTFTAVDTSLSVPSAAALIAAYDVLLVFEDGTFGNATAVGAAAAAFANAGHAVVLGTFYEQERSDGPPVNGPHGWGPLEALDPNTSDGAGTPYAPRALNTATLVVHPLSAGISSLTSLKFAGGNDAKSGTSVIGTWDVANARGRGDPAIAFRRTGAACVVHIAIAPNYPSIGVYGVDFGGDFYRLWKNAFDFGAANCTAASVLAPPETIPTLSPLGLALTALLIAAAALIRRPTAPGR
jgi:hypothetical protein